MIEDRKHLPHVPSGWAWTTAGEISELIRGVSYPKQESSKEPKDGYVPILRANNIDTELNFDDLLYVPIRRVKPEQFVNASDILVAMSSGSKDLVGKAAQAKHDFCGGFGAFCGLVRAVPGLSDRFIGLFFQSPDYRDEISRLSSGVNINNLRREHVELMWLPLPPLAEQHRIVAKVEELFTKLDAGVEGVKKIKAQLKRYRQAVLKHAFEGKLSEEWREAHKHELEPASILLERIKEERKRNAVGKRKDVPLPDTSGLPELPWGWVSGNLGGLVYIAGRIGWRGLKAEEYTKGGPLFLSVHNLNKGKYVDFADSYHISEKRYIESPEIQLRNDDILLVKDGAGIGKLGIVQGLRMQATVNSSILVIRPGEVFIPEFLFYLLMGPDMQRVVRGRITGSATPHLFQRDIRQFRLLIPPTGEQRKIAEEIERFFSMADEVEKAVEQSLKLGESLRHSILKKAFEGRLVPQDPSDEPADRLLERIREERARLKENDSTAKSKSDRQLRLV